MILNGSKYRLTAAYDFESLSQRQVIEALETTRGN